MKKKKRWRNEKEKIEGEREKRERRRGERRKKVTHKNKIEDIARHHKTQETI